jgi:aminotransferase
LQEAGVTALAFPQPYYDGLAALYRARRDLLLGILTEAGFACITPRGAYYIMTDISVFGSPDDVTFARELVERCGVGAVPGSSFYHDPAAGRQRLRFAFPKRPQTLEEVRRRLGALAPVRGR